jgi:hypothetical protein
MAERPQTGARRWIEPAEQWRHNVRRWVDAGIVSSAPTGTAATESSDAGTVATRSPGERDRPTLSPIVEVVAYVGVVVVGFGTTLFLGHYWSGLGDAGHVSVALMVTVAGLAGGYVVSQIGDAGASRLAGFLRLIGTAGAAMATAVVVGPESERHHGFTVLCVGVVVLAVSASLWRNLHRSLQFLSTLLGVVITMGAVGSVAHLRPTSTEVALLVWFFAVAVGLMSLQMLRPPLTALVVSELGCLVGALALSFPNHLGGVLLGLVSAVCAVGIGVALERPPIIVIGALGFFMFDFRVFAVYLRSANAALGAFVLGLVLVLVTLLRAWYATTVRGREVDRTSQVLAESEWHEA